MSFDIYLSGGSPTAISSQTQTFLNLMSSKENEENIITLLGIRNKRATTTGIAVDEKTPETAWEIYNTRATVYDKELIKDWNDSLNTLLIFVSFRFERIYYTNIGVGSPLFGGFDSFYRRKYETSTGRYK